MYADADLAAPGRARDACTGAAGEDQVSMLASDLHASAPAALLGLQDGEPGGELIPGCLRPGSAGLKLN